MRWLRWLGYSQLADVEGIMMFFVGDQAVQYRGK